MALALCEGIHQECLHRADIRDSTVTGFTCTVIDSTVVVRRNSFETVGVVVVDPDGLLHVLTKVIEELLNVDIAGVTVTEETEAALCKLICLIGITYQVALEDIGHTCIQRVVGQLIALERLHIFESIQTYPILLSIAPSIETLLECTTVVSCDTCCSTFDREGCLLTINGRDSETLPEIFISSNLFTFGNEFYSSLRLRVLGYFRLKQEHTLIFLCSLNDERLILSSNHTGSTNCHDSTRFYDNLTAVSNINTAITYVKCRSGLNF